MTVKYGYLRRVSSLWLSAWPIWALVLFSTLAAIRALPERDVRVVAVVPIVLLVPGSLTIGAAFGSYRRPRGTLFLGYAAVLSVVWSVFASLALYVLNILITATTIYFIMLALCAVLAVVAQARLLIERQVVGRQTEGSPEPRGQETRRLSDSWNPVARIQWLATAVAIVAGVSLLIGATYFYDHLSTPSSTGYTQLAWTNTRENNAIAVSPAGARLYFQIDHRQRNQATFKLSAAWEGSSARPIAKPLILSIGPNKTLRGQLFVPAPPGRCIYRVVLTLTEINQVDPLTKLQPSWSINADIHGSGKPRSSCGQ